MLTLPPSSVDVWLLFYRRAISPNIVEGYRRILSEEECFQEAKFHFADNRLQYLASRALLRNVLSRYIDVDPTSWRFARDAYGRPWIENRQGKDARISFSLSHTHRLIALGITCGNTVGTDAEQTRNQHSRESFDYHTFTSREVATLTRSPTSMWNSLFVDYWTLKESYVKAKGKGLLIPLNRVGFERRYDRLIASFSPETNDSPFQWKFWQFWPSECHVVAVCTQRIDRVALYLTIREFIPCAAERLITPSTLLQSE